MSDLVNTAAAFIACYSDWKLIRTRKCVQVVFEIPLEKSSEAFAALGGMPNPAAEAWFAIARLDATIVQPKESEVVDSKEKASLSTQPASVPNPPGRAPNKLSQLAGMLAKTPLFQKWAVVPDEHTAADFIRVYCNVDSRSQIVPGTQAADKFLELYDDFMSWRDADKFVEAS